MPCRKPASPIHPCRCLLLVMLQLLLVMSSGSAVAAKVTGLYSAEVPVAGQESQQRNDAIRRAFAQMLVKVTGKRDIAQHPSLQADLQKAPRYVQQYHYRLAPEQALSGTTADTDRGDEPARLLRVMFDAQAIQRLLRGRRLPVWGDNRPLGLVWLALEKGGKRRLLLPDPDRGMVDAMDFAAARRGLPMLFPLMDLEDQSGLEVADLWGGFEQNIRRASQRYSPDLILTGRLLQLSGNRWRADWRLYQSDRVASWSSQGESPEVVAANGVDSTADRLADSFAPAGGENNLSQVRLRINGVTTLEAYARAEQFLRSQGVVEQMQVVFAEADAVTYDLQVRGGVQGLAQGLALGGLLEALPGLPETEQPMAEGIDLFYQLR